MRHALLALLLLVALFNGVSSALENPTSESVSITLNHISNAALHATSPVYEIYTGIAVPETKMISSTGFQSAVGFAKAVYSLTSASLLSIDPSSGYNIAPVHITKISGSGFSDGMTAYLSKEGEASIPAKNLKVVSATEMNCIFDISGAKTGFWDLVVTKEGEAANILTGAFEVKNYSYSNKQVLNSPNPFDPARESTTVMYHLAKDTEVDVFIYTITGNLIWQDSFNAGQNGGKAGDNSISWDGRSAYGQMMSNNVYLLHVIDHSTGKTLAKGKIVIIRR